MPVYLAGRAGGFSMKNAIFGIMILAMITIFLNGCGRGPEMDVTSSPRYNFSLFGGTVWKTKVKVALVDCEQYTGRHAKTIVPPDCFDPAHPKFIPRPNMQVIRVLPVGTRLRIERLMEDNGNWGGVRVTASIEDGEAVYLEDGMLARNRFLSPGGSKSSDWGVDPDMLEK